MPNAAARPSEWLPAAAGIVAAVVALRVVLLAFDRTDLFFDEAQYWYWGQDFAFGYYSKPPAIGWVIGAVTGAAGSDAPFWVRLPAPLFHGATALLMGMVAARRFGAQAAVWTAALYVTLPMVSAGSLLISTDTIMFPFLVLGLHFWLETLDRGGPLAPALAAGAFTGAAFMAKYAALYLPLCAALAAAALPAARTRPAAAGAAAAAFLIVIAPNLAWNLGNGLATLQHTLDNADWVRDPGARAEIGLGSLATFFLAQFAVFGPMLFAALLWLCARRGDGSPERRRLVWFSWPILAIVCAQALVSEAYANWAVAAYAAGLLAVVPWCLAGRRGWLWASLGLHGALALALPLVAVVGTDWRWNDRLVLERYVGRAAMADEIAGIAAAHGGVLVADNRAVLADLVYWARDTGVEIWARPRAGRAPDHYVQTRSLPAGTTGRVVLATGDDRPPDGCASATPLATFAPEQGAYRDHPLTVWLVDAPCLQP
jgi:4-amino-4-deoxy-L-arabinose transferase-like glycosyltransferase